MCASLWLAVMLQNNQHFLYTCHNKSLSGAGYATAASGFYCETSVEENNSKVEMSGINRHGVQKRSRVGHDSVVLTGLEELRIQTDTGGSVGRQPVQLSSDTSAESAERLLSCWSRLIVLSVQKLRPLRGRRTSSRLQRAGRAFILTGCIYQSRIYKHILHHDFI